MTLDFLRIGLDQTAPQGWCELWQKAQQQGDFRKMKMIVLEVNRLLTEMENRATREGGDQLSE